MIMRDPGHPGGIGNAGGIGGAGATSACEVPVYELDFGSMSTYPNGDMLPGIWVTRPMFGDGEDPSGRTYVQFCPHPEDHDGDDALYFGGCYYDEAMSYTDAADHDKRIECFQAAELLYRHAAGKGNAVANMCLGYVYSYDRCEGRYWVDPMAEDADQPYPREERAFECLHQAASAGIPEACYKLGDMYKHGTGCSPDAAEAFRWYVRASELALREHPVILGSIALRLASCYEEGFGCPVDFARALDWYRQAIAGLEVAVEAGEVWYEKALASAHAGEKRCKQEL